MSKGLLYVEYTIVALCLSVMSLIAFSNVISRFIFNFSFAFTEEITVNLFVILTIVGTSIGIQKRAHLGFDLIYESINHKGKMVVSLFVGLVVIFFFSVIAYHGIQIALSQMSRGQITPSLGWPQWMFTMGLPVGALLCIFRTFETTIITVKAIQNESVKSL